MDSRPVTQEGGKDLDTSSDSNPQLSFFWPLVILCGEGEQAVSFRSAEKGQLYFTPITVRELDFFKTPNHKTEFNKKNLTYSIKTIPLW